MAEINISDLISQAMYLVKLMEISDRKGVKETEIEDDSRRIFLEACRELEDTFHTMELKASRRALSRLKGNLQNNKNFNRVGFVTYANDVLLRLRDELETTVFLHLDTNELKFYRPEAPLFGENATKHYPSAQAELDEAGRCLGLGRGTACVFHLMRVMEIGLRAVARRLSINDPTKPAQRNWGFMLAEIRRAIDTKKRWPRGTRKQFFEEVYASLDSVKNPWRNATMHVEHVYTVEEAENILYAVRAFISKIASRFDEDGRSIN